MTALPAKRPSTTEGGFTLVHVRPSTPPPRPRVGTPAGPRRRALSQSHPALAADLAARAAPEYEPPDPFDALTGDPPVDRFRAFGFLMLRRFFEPSLVEALRAELTRTLLAVHGDRYHDRPARSGMAARDACLLGPWAPATVDLVDSRRLVGLAQRLLGGPVLPSPCDTQGILYFDHAGWHNDTAISVRAVKFVAYVEPLDADSGALRVLPASHRLAGGALAHVHSLDVAVPDVPAHVLATWPGDVIAFDPWLFHATWGGRDRHQWTTAYLRDAISPPWRAGLMDWYADGARWADQHPPGYRPFDRAWVAEGSGDLAERRLDQRHRWMYRLDQLGVLDRFGVADAFRP